MDKFLADNHFAEGFAKVDPLDWWQRWIGGPDDPRG